MITLNTLILLNQSLSIERQTTPPSFWTISDEIDHCAATDADFDRRSRLQTRRTFAQQKPKRKWGPDAMCHEKLTTIYICLSKIKKAISPNISLTIRNVRLDSGRYATKYYREQMKIKKLRFFGGARSFLEFWWSTVVSQKGIPIRK